MSEKKGLVILFTGEGKGKTTAALGQALRAVGHGYRVLLISFLKGREYGELKSARYLPNFDIIQVGRTKFVKKNKPEHVDQIMAAEGVAIAEDKIASKEYELIILDEIIVAVDFKIIPLQKVIKLIESKPTKVNLILTGRGAPAELVHIADMVSEIKEVKHHYCSGIAARRGIEY